MGMNYYPISHYRLGEKLVEKIQHILDRLEHQRQRMGFDDRAIHQYFSYGESLDDLGENVEDGVETGIHEVLTMPQEELPGLLNKTDLPAYYKILAQERLSSEVDEGLLKLAKDMMEGWDGTKWGLYFEEKYLTPALKEMEEILGIPVYMYAGEDGEIYIGVDRGNLFVESPAHKALKEQIGGEPAVYDHSWTEWG